MSSATDSLLLKFKPKDARLGVTRGTLKAVADELGVSETSAIHVALAMLAGMVLAGYEPDEGPFRSSDVAALRKAAAAKMPKGKLVSSKSLF